MPLFQRFSKKEPERLLWQDIVLNETDSHLDYASNQRMPITCQCMTGLCCG